jgi:hypothetical protein
VGFKIMATVFTFQVAAATILIADMDENTRIVLLSLITTMGGVALAVIAIFGARRPKNGDNGGRAP